jgi:hypothetical protein
MSNSGVRWCFGSDSQVGLADGAPAQELDPGLERRKRGRTRYSQKERKSKAATLTKWTSLPGLRKTARFVELGAGMNKRLPGQDLAAACAELPAARATCAGEQ